MICVLFFRCDDFDKEKMYYFLVDTERQANARIVLNSDNNVTPHDVITENLKMKPLEKPSEVKSIVGDGNCYYRCISFDVTGVEDHYARVFSGAKNTKKNECFSILWMPNGKRLHVSP